MGVIAGWLSRSSARPSRVAVSEPVAVLVLGAIGLGAWMGRVDLLVLLPLLLGVVGLAIYRCRTTRRRSP